MSCARISFALLLCISALRCQNNFSITYEQINAPVDLQITAGETSYTLDFFASNNEANFKGYIVNLGTTADEAKSGKAISVFCECDSDCRETAQENPTTKRSTSLSVVATTTALTCEIETGNEGNYLALRTLVSELALDDSLSITECVRQYNDNTSSEQNSVRCSRPSNAVEIPDLVTP